MARRGLPPREAHCLRGQPGTSEAHSWISFVHSWMDRTPFEISHMYLQRPNRLRIDFCPLFKLLTRKSRRKPAIYLFICKDKPFLAS